MRNTAKVIQNIYYKENGICAKEQWSLVELTFFRSSNAVFSVDLAAVPALLVCFFERITYLVFPYMRFRQSRLT